MVYDICLILLGMNGSLNLIYWKKIAVFFRYKYNFVTKIRCKEYFWLRYCFGLESDSKK